MKEIVIGLLCASMLISFCIGIQLIYDKGKRNRVMIYFALFAFGSSLWSAGFAGMFRQMDPDKAYLCRTFGVAGVFLYTIMVQILVQRIGNIKKFYARIANAVACLGIGLYFFAVQPGQVEFVVFRDVMSYKFKMTLTNTLYVLYFVIVAVNIACMVVYTYQTTKRKSIREFMKKFMLVEIVIVVGMSLDVILPMFDVAIPGSCMIQVWGVIVIFRALLDVEYSKISANNVAQFIYHSLTVPLMFCECNGKIKMANDAAISFLTGDERTKQFPETTAQDLFGIEAQELFEFDGRHRELDIQLEKRNLFCLLTVDKIYDKYEDIIGFMIAVSDMTERVKNVQSLEIAMEQAERANTAKSTFLANMSHEIRTPMNAIVGFSELLLKKNLDGQSREFVLDIQRSSHNLLAIINDILDFSKIESGKMELVCSEYFPASMFRDVMMIISGQVKKKRLDFEMNLSPEIPKKLYGDKIRVRGVLTNLLNNAVKYTKEGKITLDVKVRNMDMEKAILDIRVSDTGVGIRKEEVEHLFDSFSQADRKIHYGVEGTGLGLAIVKGYVELMNGELNVSSVYGKGTVFSVTLEQKVIDSSPMECSIDKEDDALEGFRMGDMKVKDTKVLLVDDNEINLEVGSYSLQQYGMEVELAHSGQEAIDLCMSNNYDIIFMDQMMPEIDGVEAMKEIRKINPYFALGGLGKIIVLTANAVSGVRQQLLQEGFDEYLGKPMNYKQLERLLQKFLPKNKVYFEEGPEQVVVGQEVVQTAGQKTNAKNIEVPEPAVVGLETLEPVKKETQEEILERLLPGVNVKQGLVYSAGRVDIYLRTMKMVYESGETSLSELCSLKEKQDWKNYTIKVHALKGLARNLGADEEADFAFEHEKAGKADNISYIEETIDALLETFRSLFANMYQALLACDVEVTEQFPIMPKEQPRVWTEEDFLAYIADIREFIDVFDFPGAVKMAKELSKKDLSPEQKEMVSQIEKSLDTMDMDKLEQLLK